MPQTLPKPRTSSRPAHSEGERGYLHLPLEVIATITDPTKMHGLHALTYTIYSFLVCETYRQSAERPAGEERGVLHLSRNGVPDLCKALSEHFLWPVEKIETALQLLETEQLIKIYARHITVCCYGDHLATESLAARRMRRMRNRKRIQKDEETPRASSIRVRKKEMKTGIAEKRTPLPTQAAKQPSAQDGEQKVVRTVPVQAAVPVKTASKPKKASTGGGNAESSVFSMKELGL